MTCPVSSLDSVRLIAARKLLLGAHCAYKIKDITVNSTTKLDPSLAWPFDLIAPLTETEQVAELLAETEEAPL